MQPHNHLLAVQMLDLLLEFFADDARWMQGRYHDGDRRRCLVGALDYLRQEHRIPYAGAVYFLQQALPSRQSGLINFNDRLCVSVAELRSLVVRARALALEDAQAALAAAAMERKLLVEVERYRATRAPIQRARFDRPEPVEPMPSVVKQCALKQAA